MSSAAATSVTSNSDIPYSLPLVKDWSDVIRGSTNLKEYIAPLEVNTLHPDNRPPMLIGLTMLSQFIDAIGLLQDAAPEVYTAEILDYVKLKSVIFWNALSDLQNEISKTKTTSPEAANAITKMGTNMLDLIRHASIISKPSLLFRIDATNPPVTTLNGFNGFKETLQNPPAFEYSLKHPDLYNCWMNNMRWTKRRSELVLETQGSILEQFNRDMVRVTADNVTINGIAYKEGASKWVYSKDKAHDPKVIDPRKLLNIVWDLLSQKGEPYPLRHIWRSRYLDLFLFCMCSFVDTVFIQSLTDKLSPFGLAAKNINAHDISISIFKTGKFKIVHTKGYAIFNPETPELELPEFPVVQTIEFYPPMVSAVRYDAESKPFTGSINYEYNLPTIITQMICIDERNPILPNLTKAVTICDNFVLELMRRLPFPQQGSLSGKPAAAWLANGSHKTCLKAIIVRMIAALAFRYRIVPHLYNKMYEWNGDTDATTNLIQKWEKRLRAEARKYSVNTTNDEIQDSVLAELNKIYGSRFNQSTSATIEYCIRVQNCIEYIKGSKDCEKDIRYLHLALNASISSAKVKDEGLSGTILWPNADFNSQRRAPGSYELKELPHLLQTLANLFLTTRVDEILLDPSKCTRIRDNSFALSHGAAAASAAASTGTHTASSQLLAAVPAAASAAAAGATASTDTHPVIPMVSLASFPRHPIKSPYTYYPPPPPPRDPVNTKIGFRANPMNNAWYNKHRPAVEGYSLPNPAGGKRKGRKTAARRGKRRRQTKKKQRY